MATQQKPIIGSWYVNLTGQLIKVWAVSYERNELARVVIEYLSGTRRIIAIHEWYSLDLEMNFHRLVRKKKATEETQY